MAITYQYETGSKTVRAKASGVVTTEEILDYVNSIIKDGKIEANYIEIVDFEFVTDLKVK